MDIPFLSFAAQNERIENEAKEVFARFFQSQYYVLGPMTRQFEEDYARFNEVPFAIGVSNGLDALHLALKIGKIGPGDEVIVPSNTYIATVLAVEMAGATPVFVEPDIQTYNLSPTLVANAIGPKTKGIIPVHLYGQACEMGAIMELATQANLWVVEDNAQGHLARFKGKMTGSFGHLNATSFYPTKNVGALGEAGALTTEHADLDEQARIWRNYGSEKRYYNQVKGFNNRIDELQAGLLSMKLKYVKEWTSERQTIASWYRESLADIEGLTLPYLHPDAEHVYHLFVVRTTRRDALQAHLDKSGIKTVIHYPIPPHLQQAYAGLGLKKGAFPVAEELANTSLSLPLYPGLKKEQVAYVAEQIKAFFS
jgi:dTDP-4-amino-4,6-dideoxygalactose transaminase